MARIFLIKGYNRYPAITFPLGLMYLAGYLRSRQPEHEFFIYDLRLPDHDYEGLERELAGFAPDIVGLSVLTIEKVSMHKSAAIARRVAPEATILVGGPHAASDPHDVMSDTHIDFAVTGEGEITFSDFVDRWRNGAEVRDIPGLAWRDEAGEVHVNENPPAIDDLDALPFPAWDLTEMEAYQKTFSMSPVVGKHRKYMNLFTSRACPYKCTYCHTIFGKGFRVHSPRRVVEEMTYLRDNFGIEDFELLDDIFNFDRKRTLEICRAKTAAGLTGGMSFPNGLRTDRLDREVLIALKDAGCHHISVAVETATPRLQKMIRKNLKTDVVREVIRECYRLKIMARGFFMLGFPTETREEMQATLRYAWNSELVSALFFNVVPYKGTELADQQEARLEALGIDPTAEEYLDYHTAQYSISEVSPKELANMQRWALVRFYFSFRRIRIILRQVPPGMELFEHAWIALQRITRMTPPSVSKAGNVVRSLWDDLRKNRKQAA